MNNSWSEFFTVVGLFLAAAIVLAAAGLLLIHRRLSRLRVPPDADLPTTLRIVPLSLVLVLDLLDFGLDILAAPIVWLILSRYRLQALRNVAAIEALIPFTQVIPTLTVAWFAVRALGLGTPSSGTGIDAQEEGPGYYVPRTGRR